MKCKLLLGNNLPQNDPGTPETKTEGGSSLFPFFLILPQNSDKAMKIELKSLVGRSFKNTWNSGVGLEIIPHLSSMTSMIFRITDNVLGPEEQPRSAMAKHCGALDRKRSTTAATVTCFTNSMPFFWQNKQVTMLKLEEQKLMSSTY